MRSGLIQNCVRYKRSSVGMGVVRVLWLEISTPINCFSTRPDRQQRSTWWWTQFWKGRHYGVNWFMLKTLITLFLLLFLSVYQSFNLWYWWNLLLEVASNFSDFFFFFHFQGLKSLPSICILVFLCAGGVAEHTDAAEPTFSLSHLALFDFFPEMRQS